MDSRSHSNDPSVIPEAESDLHSQEKPLARQEMESFSRRNVLKTSNSDRNSQKSLPLLLLMLYTTSYMLLFIWLFFEGWLNQFQALWTLWAKPSGEVSLLVFNCLYLLIGAVLASGLVNILLLQNRGERTGSNQILWNGFAAPLLAITFSLILFAVLQVILMVFSGGATVQNSSEVSRLGFLCVGFLGSAYALRVFQRQLTINQVSAGTTKKRSENAETRSIKVKNLENTSLKVAPRRILRT